MLNLSVCSFQPLDLLGPHLQEKHSSIQLSPLAAPVNQDLVTFMLCMKHICKAF